MEPVNENNHHIIATVAEIPGTARLIRLNPETDRFRIYALVGLDPEIVANLQAVYSRDPRSITSRANILTPEGARKFMEQYYVNYGHNSIADCGNFVLFFEDVPMQVAKQLQRDPRYNGQEASTRYMNLSKVVAINSHNLEAGAQIQERWLSFYRKNLPKQMVYTSTQFPIQPGEDFETYCAAVEKRAFDVLRGFLPIGTPTNVSWSVSLRLAKDHLLMLTQHPDLDTRLVASAAVKGLCELFPGTFAIPSADATDEKGQRAYQRHVADLDWQRRALLLDSKLFDGLRRELVSIKDPLYFRASGLDTIRIPADYLELLQSRPLFTELTLSTNRFGRAVYEFALDYGSFRDLQRHRAADIDVPYADVDLGFHPWYLDQLPPKMRKEAEELIKTNTAAILALSDDPFVRQPYVAMGFRVPVRMEGGLHAIIYIGQLRSKTDVHPTVRDQVRCIAHHLQENVEGHPLIHIDENDDDFSRRRARATIIDRATGESIENT